MAAGQENPVSNLREEEKMEAHPSDDQKETHDDSIVNQQQTQGEQEELALVGVEYPEHKVAKLFHAFRIWFNFRTALTAMLAKNYKMIENLREPMAKLSIISADSESSESFCNDFVNLYTESDNLYSEIRSLRYFFTLVNAIPLSEEARRARDERIEQQRLLNESIFNHLDDDF